ncbi:MAG: hypothetical protein ACJZ47_00615 [bacterium]
MEPIYKIKGTRAKEDIDIRQMVIDVFQKICELEDEMNDRKLEEDAYIVYMRNARRKVEEHILYLKEQLEEGIKRLPNQSTRIGPYTFFLKKSPDKIVIEDEEAALQELQGLGQLGEKCIKTSQKVLKSEVKKLIKEDGPDLDYVKIAEGKASLSIIKKY